MAVSQEEPDTNLAESEPIKSKIIKGSTLADDNTKDVKITVQQKYLSNFWTTLEMPLINCGTDLILHGHQLASFTNSNGAGTFAITDTKVYVPVVTLSTQDNVKLLDQLKSGFKRTINWNQSKVSIEDKINSWVT